MITPTLKLQALEKGLQLIKEQKELESLKREIIQDLNRLVAQAAKRVERRGYSIKEIAIMDNLSYTTVKNRALEMQKSKEYKKYIRNYACPNSGKQTIRIDLEGWILFGQRR